MWNKAIAILFGMSVLWSGSGDAEEDELGLRLSYQQQQFATSSFGIPDMFRPIPSKLLQEEFFLHLQQGFFTFDAQLTAEQQADGSYADVAGIIYELYTDFIVGGVEGSIGKKVASWGVGYGYRPLDVIQREDRQALRIFDLEGVPMVMLEHFTADSAITAVVANRLRFSGMTPHLEIYEGALKYSTLFGNSDVHLLIYQREGEGPSAGAGISSTYGEHLEFHGSVRYLSTYHILQHRLAGRPPALLNAADVFTLQEKRHGILALLGISWTWENGFSLLLEGWHDDTAWSQGQWQELLAINQFQRQQLISGAPERAVYGNILANSRIYSGQNLLKDTLFMRLSYDGEKIDPDVSLLYTPVDDGAVLTASVDYDWSDRILLFGSARWMTGRGGSAYREAADRWQLFVGLQISGRLL